MKGILGLVKKLAIVLVVLVVIGAVFGGGSGEKASSGSQADKGQVEAAADEGAASEEQDEAEPEADAKAEEQAEPEPEPVEYQDVSLSDLLDTLENNPLNAKKTYEGAYVRFSGVLDNIDASGDYFSLGTGEEWSFDHIQCFIRDDETLDRIAGASMGDTITVCGPITSVGEIMGYSMDVDYIE